MTDEQINRAIAEACGWTQISDDAVTGKAPGETCNRVKFLPDYCNDLNAMHEAEKLLPDDIWHVFCNKLARVTGAEDSLERSFICATARQRAEAFLRTVGKWIEQ